jgi:hypothetical protein
VESLTDPVLSELRSVAPFSWCFTQICLASGKWLDLIIDSGELAPGCSFEDLYRWVFWMSRPMAMLELSNSALGAQRRGRHLLAFFPRPCGQQPWAQNLDKAGERSQLRLQATILQIGDVRRVDARQAAQVRPRQTRCQSMSL